MELKLLSPVFEAHIYIIFDIIAYHARVVCYDLSFVSSIELLRTQ